MTRPKDPQRILAARLREKEERRKRRAMQRKENGGGNGNGKNNKEQLVFRISPNASLRALTALFRE